MKKTCNNCEWLYEEHCCNGVSDMCTEAVSSDDNCDKWGDRRMSDIAKAIGYLKEPIGKSLDEHAEAIKSAIEALEKQMPSKVINITREYDGNYGSCASCKNIIYDFISPEFCKNCGQKLNWR